VGFIFVEVEILKAHFRNILKKCAHLMKEEEFLILLHNVLFVIESVESTQFLSYICLPRCILKHLDSYKCREHRNVGVKIYFVFRI